MFVEEAGTGSAQHWLSKHREAHIAVSAWTEAEFMSAAGNRQRGGSLSTDRHSRPLIDWQVLKSSLEHIDFDDNAFSAAIQWLARPDLGAGDALHLAIAARADATPRTFDQRLFKAGRSLGFDVEMP